MSEKLPVDEKILLNKEVSCINWDIKNNNGAVKVKCSDGSSYSGDFVISTVSIGVLKERYDSLFSPPLPSYKQNAIKGLGFGAVGKILLKFTTKWWPDDSKGFSLLVTQDDLEKEYPNEINAFMKVRLKLF